MLSIIIVQNTRNVPKNLAIKSADHFIVYISNIPTHFDHFDKIIISCISQQINKKIFFSLFHNLDNITWKHRNDSKLLVKRTYLRAHAVSMQISINNVILFSLVIFNPIIFTEHFWLGASDIQNEGSWVWMDTVGRIPFSDQKMGEPNNLHASADAENCLEIWSQSYKWNDSRCEIRHSIVCETS